ncbi:hypothetical protein HanRHA438_Chr12g0538001 [Helianthus annuus]|nr:hypothetical protein HanRHA438_Chr12g0538001 [Helianthus annuus]
MSQLAYFNDFTYAFRSVYVALVLLGTVYAPAATRGPLILVLFKFFYKLMHQLEQQAPKCTCHIILLQFLEFRYLEKGLKTSRY